MFLRKRANAVPPAADRRHDQTTADLVEVGLLFVGVFGRDKGLAYFACTAIYPHVYQRVLLGPCRRKPPRTGPGDLVLTD
jgi:hypothetical protein